MELSGVMVGGISSVAKRVSHMAVSLTENGPLQTAVPSAVSTPCEVSISAYADGAD